ncbi:MAG: class I SAM-dependent methyltransferase [Actinomycetota bacterium]|nr:class I SAM-dependent methyltransferase [Actinomycetota bacterium]
MDQSDMRAKSLAIWDEMAAGWHDQADYMWETTRGLGEWMVDKLAPNPGDTVLDIAAGPGWTGFVAAKLVGDSGKLISTDFSSSMVEVAEKTAVNLGLTNIEFRRMDAERMDLPEDSVDGALCRWGYMLMMDPSKALSETRRVLKPGGRLVFSVWGTPADNPWATMAGMVMVNLGKIELPDPDAPGSIFSMSSASRIEPMLSVAGFDHWEVEQVPVPWRFKSQDELWSFYSQIAGAISIMLKDMSEEEVAEVREAVIQQAATFLTDGEYRFPGMTVNAVAW